MEWLGKLLGTNKAINSIIDKDNGLLSQAGAWIGNMDYTPEEKAEANAQTREWGIRQLEALAPFKIVQRILAFATAFMWVCCGLIYMTAVWIEAFHNAELAPEAVKLVLVLPLEKFILSDYVLWPTLSVFALYFSEIGRAHV